MQWVATFKDKEVLRQFQDGKETLFKEVLDRQDDLEYFAIGVKDVLCSVNLINGSFTFLKGNTPIKVFANETEGIRPPNDHKYKYRLIFFNKCLRLFNQQLQAIGGEHVLYANVGWQITTSDGRNIKRIIQVYPNGMFNFVTQ